MELGFIGLGRMGMNMVARLQRDRHRVVTYDRTADKVRNPSGTEGSRRTRRRTWSWTPSK